MDNINDNMNDYTNGNVNDYMNGNVNDYMSGNMNDYTNGNMYSNMNGYGNRYDNNINYGTMNDNMYRPNNGVYDNLPGNGKMPENLMMRDNGMMGDNDMMRDNNMMRDNGKIPYVVNVPQMAIQNSNYRKVIWTGDHLQMTLMNIPSYSDIGAEIHTDNDQFIRIEHGMAILETGMNRNQMNNRKKLYPGDGVCIPAGTWHNVINASSMPLKLSSFYAPPHHQAGASQRTKMDVER